MESIVNGLNPNFSLDFLNTIQKFDSKNIPLRFNYSRINTFMWKLKSVPSKDDHPFKVIHRKIRMDKNLRKSEVIKTYMRSLSQVDALWRYLMMTMETKIDIKEAKV